MPITAHIINCWCTKMQTYFSTAHSNRWILSHKVDTFIYHLLIKYISYFYKNSSKNSNCLQYHIWNSRFVERFSLKSQKFKSQKIIFSDKKNFHDCFNWTSMMKYVRKLVIRPVIKDLFKVKYFRPSIPWKFLIFLIKYWIFLSSPLSQLSTIWDSRTSVSISCSSTKFWDAIFKSYNEIPWHVPNDKKIAAIRHGMRAGAWLE